jgi:hypothetical protein
MDLGWWTKKRNFPHVNVGEMKRGDAGASGKSTILLHVHGDYPDWEMEIAVPEEQVGMVSCCEGESCGKSRGGEGITREKLEVTPSNLSARAYHSNIITQNLQRKRHFSPPLSATATSIDTTPNSRVCVYHFSCSFSSKQTQMAAIKLRST